MRPSFFSTIAAHRWVGYDALANMDLSFRHQISGTLRRRPPRFRTVQHETDNRCVSGWPPARHIGESFGLGDAHRQMEVLLREIDQAS